MQGPEPSTDGATSLGVVAMTIVKGPSLKSPSFDAQRVAIPCHATLPSDARVRLRTTWCKEGGRDRGRPRHAERDQLAGMVGVGHLVVGEVAS